MHANIINTQQAVGLCCVFLGKQVNKVVSWTLEWSAAATDGGCISLVLCCFVLCLSCYKCSREFLFVFLLDIKLSQTLGRLKHLVHACMDCRILTWVLRHCINVTQQGCSLAHTSHISFAWTMTYSALESNFIISRFTAVLCCTTSTLLLLIIFILPHCGSM